MQEPLTVLFLCLLLHCTLQGTLSQSHTCSYQDEESGYTLSWTAGVGFVDFFFNYKHFPTRAAHWTGVGFGDEVSVYRELT
jgi:hypothetical protein